MSIKKQVVFFLVTLFSFSCSCQEATFAEKLISKFKKGAINSTTINWETFEKEVKESLKISKIAEIEKALTLYGKKYTQIFIINAGVQTFN